ncbi:hypothetical protein [Oceanithermus sp.]
MKYFYLIILFNLFIVFSPFKILAYVSPFIVAIYYILFVKSKKFLLKIAGWTLIWLFMVALYGLIYPEFHYENALIAFVTWFGIFVVLCMPYLGKYAYQAVRKLEKWIWLILALESALGIFQAVYGAIQSGGFDLNNGDRVEGTIHPWLAPSNTYSNVMFAINISIILLYLYPHLKRNKLKYIIYIMGIIVFILASVMHAIIFLGISIIISTSILIGYKINIKWIAVTISIFLTAFILIPIIMPKNVNLVGKFTKQLISRDVPRSVSIQVAFTELPKEYPLQPFIGLGPGQYSSRAGLMCTGYYFGGFNNPRDVPLLPNSPTEPQQKFLIPLWRWHASNRYFGSTQKPYSSWLTIYTEWGIVGVIILIYILFYISYKIKILKSSYSIKAIIMTSIWFIFLLGFQENNWEIPQAWFGSIMLIRLLYDSERYKSQMLQYGGSSK